MSVIPWGRFHFIGYAIAVSITFSVLLLDSLIFFCTTYGLLPIFVRSWTKKIRTYSALMAVLGIMFFVFGISTFFDRQTENGIKNFLEIKWKNRESFSMKESTDQFWDNVQMEYTCCGFNSSFDYNVVPDSCCASEIKPCTVGNAHGMGCYGAVKYYYEQFLVIMLASISFTLSLVCLMLIIWAQFLGQVFRLPNSS